MLARNTMKKQLLRMMLGIGISTYALAQPGTLDESFNGKGIKDFSFMQNRSNDSVTATLLQPDGKLLVALVDGYNLDTYTDAQIIRLLPDGSRDNSFGVGGKVSIRKVYPYLVSTSVNNNFFINSMALREDGGIVLAGHLFETVKKNSTPVIASLTADGSKDDTFGKVSGIGKGYKEYGYQDYAFRTIHIHSSGIMVAGAAKLKSFTSLDDFVFLGLDRYGEPVYTFGDDGELTLDLGQNSSDILTSAVLHDRDGILYAAGYTVGSTTRFSIAAINVKTGAPIAGFGGFFGTKILPLAPAPLGGTVNKCSALQFSADSSKLVLAGYNQRSFSDIDFMVYKIDRKKATDDNSFSGDAIALYDEFSATTNYAYSLAVQSDDKLLIGGYSNTNSIYWSLIRTKADGALDPSFDKDGKIIYDGQNGMQSLRTDTGISGLHYLKGSNKHLLIGNFYGSVFQDVMVKRLNSDGSADNSYGTKSDVLCWILDAVSTVEDVLLRPDGKLLAGGYMSSNGSTYGVLALFNKDGSLDPSFRNSYDEPGTQYLYSFFPIGPGGNPLPFSRITKLAETSDGKLLVAGHFSVSSPTNTKNMFVMQLKKNSSGLWKRDSTGFGTNGYWTNAFGTGDDYVHDMIVQPDGKILLYGYVTNASTVSIAVVRLTNAGAIDGTFATGGTFTGTYLKAGTTAIMNASRIQFLLQHDKKIICTGPYTNAGLKKFMAFRLLENGAFDPGFNNSTNGTYVSSFSDAESRAILMMPDKGIVLAGIKNNGVAAAQNDYAFAKLDLNGTIDTDFNSTGSLFLNRGFTTAEMVTDLHLESSGNIVATGLAAGTAYLITSLRISPTGVPDRTFSGNGASLLTKGYPTGSSIIDGSLYIFGQRNASEELETGIIAKVKLGSGPTVKITNLAMADLTKTFGTAPFKLEAITNSPAPIYYNISQSRCATVDATTGIVKITCATVDLGEDIIVRAIQLPVTGYTGDTAVAKITVEKAAPRILFSSQGDLVDSVFILSAVSTSGAPASFTQLDGAEYIQFLPSNFAGEVKVLAEGTSTVRVSFAATENYLAGQADATIYGYTSLQLPEANYDEAALAFGEGDNTTIDVLSNDAAYTGTIEPKYIDLDLNNRGVQSEYVSPSLGLFKVDTTTGIVTYTPFSGFIGSGDIYYTIQDSRGKTSAPGIIHVAVVQQEDVPALKATEMVTPNNDGLNEAFVIGFVDLEKENKLKIFDRNGLELFTQDNYQNDWTGTLPNGKAVENGIYYYVFVEGDNDGQRELKGAFEIRR